MAQPNKREEQDKDPRTAKKQGNPLERSNPNARTFQHPKTDKKKITKNKGQNKNAIEENEEDMQDTSGGA